MKCRDCRQGRRFAQGAVDCLMYGMIIREDHECTREGAEARGDDDIDGAGGGEAEEGLAGVGGFGEEPGVFPGSGEREGFPGMEG